jgi:hypothetical protein
MVASEIALGSRKLQAGITRVLLVHMTVCFLAIGALIACGEIRVMTVTIFWAGAFLSWFAIRSHIESSILLRMIHLLEKQGETPERLIRDYESSYGTALRREELCRAGLVKKNNGQLTLTAKGRSIFRIVSLLR